MNKKLLTVTILSATIVVCFGINLNTTKQTATLTLKNIEALAIGEGGGNTHHICYYSSVVKVGYTYYDCGSCTQVLNEKGKGSYTKCFR